MKISINNREPIQISGNTWQDLLKYLDKNSQLNEELAECTINYITKDEAIQKELRDNSKPLTKEQTEEVVKNIRMDLMKP